MWQRKRCLVVFGNLASSMCNIHLLEQMFAIKIIIPFSNQSIIDKWDKNCREVFSFSSNRQKKVENVFFWKLRMKIFSLSTCFLRSKVENKWSLMMYLHSSTLSCVATVVFNVCFPHAVAFSNVMKTQKCCDSILFFGVLDWTIVFY